MNPTRADGRARLLSTKLRAPRHDVVRVRRARLLSALDEGAERGITLICAPAGFGKTTLVADWLHRHDRRAAWVSLDSGDSDPVLFWSYVAAACQEVEPTLGLDAGSLLASGRPSADREALLSLLNDIASGELPVTLVLDDYHLVDSAEVHQGMAVLAERRPANLHLIVVSRTQPAFPLSRLRAQGRLSDITHEDLRFTVDEAAAFLRDVMGLEMASSTVAKLEHRTEGWVAGLQLAALSMRGSGDREAVVDALSGGHRHIADFLAEEVLRQQPSRVATFLLQVSVLDRMCGSLCNALTRQDDGHALLRELARSNLFVIGLDERQEWYRFHHLFGEFLRTRLDEKGDQEGRSLHDRASRWFEAEGYGEEAVAHALGAGDDRRAADLIERNWRTLDRRHQSGTWRRWAEALPRDVLDARPVLTMGYGWALLDAGEIDDGEVFLDRTESWLNAPSQEMVVADEAEFAALPGTLAAARAYVAQARGDMAATERHAMEALELIPEDDHFYRGIPAVTVGLAQWARGLLPDAEESFQEAVRSFRVAGNGLFTTMALFALAELQRLQGRLGQAEITYRRALRSRDARGVERARIHRGLGQLLLERGSVVDAEAELEESRRLSSMPPDHRLLLALADLHQVKGSPGQVDECLEEAGEPSAPQLIPESRSVPGRRARWAVDQGRYGEVEDWIDGASNGASGPLSLSALYDLMTCARLRVARLEGGRASVHEVEDLLQRIRDAAERAGSTGSLIEVLLLQLRMAVALGEEERASELMDEALDLARPEGLFRVFLQDRRALGEWFRQAALRHPECALARRLSAACTGPAPLQPGATGARQPVSPLTPREVDIMRLMAAGLTNKEIARQCFISVSTVKRHTANIYLKLEVSNRTKAAARADELGLL